MRTLILALVALPLGCAHQQSSTQASANEPTAQPPPQAQAQAQASKETRPPEPPPGVQPSAEASASPAVTCGLMRVHFEFDSAALNKDSKAALDQMAGCLQQYHGLRVRLEGNTDERGSKEYNQQLGERRAQAVLDYLSDKGVSQDQLHAVSFGEERPVCGQSDEECWAKNRRTAIRPTCRL